MTFSTSRRAMLGAAAALAAAPAAALASASPAVMPAALETAPAAAGAVRALWDKVIDLSIRMNAHAQDIAAADRGTGLPGWMYVPGEANALGNARYEALIEILKSTPASSEDIAIIARAATHHDILDGPKSFAHQQLAMAAMTLQAA